MRVSLATSFAAALVILVPAAHPQEAQPTTGHTGHSSHASHADSSQAPHPTFAADGCPPRDAATSADMVSLGIIERCADIELLPNMGAFRLATYLRVDAARALGKPVDGIRVETAPGHATFTIPHDAAFEGYAICNLDQAIRSEVPRSGRFKPKHGWAYQDAHTASYHWDVKERVAQGATAPHLRVWAYFMAIPTEHLQAGIERKWCRTAGELGSLPTD